MIVFRLPFDDGFMDKLVFFMFCYYLHAAVSMVCCIVLFCTLSVYVFKHQ